MGTVTHLESLLELPIFLLQALAKLAFTQNPSGRAVRSRIVVHQLIGFGSTKKGNSNTKRGDALRALTVASTRIY